MANTDRLQTPVMVVRQPRILSAGLSTIALALLIVFVVTPFLRNWRMRERQIDAAQVQFDRLNAVLVNRAVTTRMLAARDRDLSLQPTRVLRAHSRALASSALQSMVQDMADASHVVVTRLDVANVAAGSELPLTLSANGDIYGLADLLLHFRNARYAIDVDKMLVQVNSALRGAPDVLQVTLSLQAPVIIE